MALETVTPRLAATAGLLAIVPVLIYGVTDSGLAGVVSAVNVVLIIGSLYLAMSPVEGTHGDGHGHDHGGDGNGTAG
ncbi:cytochrome-ba3 oxidase subunit [Natrinema sp. CBA1119]|uniref:cytochrome-ba3 oxidase subunit n=1 Tax=Natrinema sp. CBA1119 TaxID=1608465 RepID=UPI000BF68E29|nr:cytochrome-ba3 oxidase subunit [Natrinema sp. CBA1119]PGF15541.1 cytochrome-ba3 oxidase subunit [Natrinema sp. CBA1119]